MEGCLILQDAPQSVARQSILVVEKDNKAARSLQRFLSESGFKVVGPAPTPHYASLIVGKRRLHGAILDVLVPGEDIFPLADSLIQQRVPIIFVTSRDECEIRRRYGAVAVLRKPVCFDVLGRQIATFGRPPGPKDTCDAPMRRIASTLSACAPDGDERLPAAMFKGLRI